ncbi:flippase [Chitinophaga silvisoli]|uniref:Flippase n=1 Tax=Chitinophaga silvisoli TaxID=2291814 RepID=A0A3E1P6M6_9BACT|nr:flippase [Chitinophaga silvisoli]RFM35843.1 flippase [Chitinophaga silvisoli]
MRSVKRNFVYNSLLTVCNILFPIISFPYASRVLGVTGIGKTQFILTFAQYFVIFSALGIPIYGLRETSKVRDDRTALSKLFSEIVVINVIASLIVMVVYVAMVVGIPRFQQDASYYYLAGLIIIGSFSNVDWLYSGLENFGVITFRSVTIKLLAFIALFCFVHTATDTYIYLSISVFALIGNQIWNLVSLHKVVSFTLSGLDVRRHLKPVFLTFGVMLAVSLYTQFDTVLLGLLGNEPAVACYTAAIKLNRVALPLITALGTVLIPRITIAIKDGDTMEQQRLFDQSFWFVCFLGIPMMAGLYLFAPELITLFAGKAFADAIIPMQVMGPLVFVVGMAHIMAVQFLIPGGYEKQYFIAVICGTVISLALNFLLVPRFLAVGAAVTNIMTEVVVTLIAGYFVFKYYLINVRWKMVIYNLLIVIVFLPIGWLCRKISHNELIILVTGIPLCALYYLLFQVLVVKDQQLQLLNWNTWKKAKPQEVAAEGQGIVNNEIV